MSTASEFYPLKIDSVQPEANDTLCVSLVVPEAFCETFAFRQGQYLTFRAEVNGEEMRRSYSICAAVGEPLKVAIKRIEGGRFSEFAHAHFEAGLTLEVMPPAGSFFSALDPDAARRYLCIAAGSGITPIISNIKTVLAVESESRVTLLYGNRRSGSMIFKEQLCWLKNAYMTRFQWINIFSQESQAAPILNGRIDNRKGAALNQHLISIRDFDLFFLCGPESMISEVARGLRSEGIAEEQIHYELFSASAEDANTVVQKHQERARSYAGVTSLVEVLHRGRAVSFDVAADGENILDGAIEQGLDLPFSCKGGVCATCKAKVTEGKVEMDLNHALSEAEVQQGYV
ncbi:MAG: 2Fe-2S iron-sulfur cluster-binding protein, partial [Pseudomonadales bacterium]